MEIIHVNERGGSSDFIISSLMFDKVFILLNF